MKTKLLPLQNVPSPLPKIDPLHTANISNMADNISLRKRDRARFERKQIVIRELNGPLFIGNPKAIEPRQGIIGDCYFLCALGAVAHTQPQVLENSIRSHGNGTYQVFFWNRLTPRRPTRESVIVRGTIACNAKDNKPIYARVSSSEQSQALWPQIAEKAYAKWKGGYDAIGEGGLVEHTLEEITGEPTRLFFSAEHHPDLLWNILQKSVAQSWPSTVCTYGRKERPEIDEVGFHPNHLHIVTGVHWCRGTKLIQLRDPFDNPTCGKLNRPDTNGVFVITWSEFLTYFAELHINSGSILEIPSPPYPSTTIGEALERSYVFKSLKPAIRKKIISNFKRTRVEAKKNIVTQGTKSDGYYFIHSGTASVEIKNTTTDRNQRVAILKSGDQFGELSIIRNTNRAATIRSLTPLIFYKMSVANFHRLIENYPGLLERFERRFELQLWMQKVKRRVNALSIDNLLQAGKEETHSKGNIIFQEGDKADCFYLVLDGIVELYLRRLSKKRSTRKVHSGEIFGEMGALKHLSRNINARAQTQLKLLRIDISTLATVLSNFDGLQRLLECIADRRERKLKGLQSSD